MVDLFNLLRKDHEKIKGLLERLEVLDDAPGNLEKKKRLFHDLMEVIDFHMTAEERFFYARLNERDDTRTMALTALEEHRAIEMLMRELHNLIEAPGWRARVHLFQANFHSHIEDEEENIFEDARETLDEGLLKSIAGQLSQRKREWLATAE